MTCFSKAFIEAQIAILETQLNENATAMSEAQKVLQMSLDTGQTRQSRMNQQLSQLSIHRQRMLDELAYWKGLLCGSGSFTAKPGW